MGCCFAAFKIWPIVRSVQKKKKKSQNKNDKIMKYQMEDYLYGHSQDFEIFISFFSENLKFLNGERKKKKKKNHIKI